MSQQTNDQVLPAESPFVTASQAMDKLNQLIALAPTGGTRFGITTSYISTLMLSTPGADGSDEWRIGVSIEVPRFATMVGGQLARWGLPGSRRRIEFVVKAETNVVTVGCENGPKHKAHKYAVLNGSFQCARGLSTEMKVARSFRDREARNWYDTMFDSTEFEKVLDVVRSEITGQPAFGE